MNTKNAADALKGLQAIEVVPRDAHAGYSGVQINIGMHGAPIALPVVSPQVVPPQLGTSTPDNDAA